VIAVRPDSPVTLHTRAVLTSSRDRVCQPGTDPGAVRWGHFYVRLGAAFGAPQSGTPLVDVVLASDSMMRGRRMPTLAEEIPTLAEVERRHINACAVRIKSDPCSQVTWHIYPLLTHKAP
jgi:hypothetical protein